MKSGLKLLSNPMVGWFRHQFGRADTKDQFAEDTQSQISRVIWDWPPDEPFRVQIAFEKHPELRANPRAIIEFAVEEFANRRERGESLSATAFARQFPAVQTDLLDSLVVDQGFFENSDWVHDILSRKPEQYGWPAIGETIAGYTLLESLGAGGFSRVYLADDPKVPDRKVALKLCRQETHEATSLANLNHRSIGVVYDVARDDDRKLGVISMQYRSRTTLHNVIAKAWRRSRPATATVVWDEVRTANRLEGEVPEWSRSAYSDWVLDLAIELARGLAESHENGIVHCDLKPANVLVDREGRPILVDFNVAFRRDAAASPGNAGGTLPYMAPEQIRAFAGRGFSEIGAATDLFGLGATLYELLTGRLPFGPVQSADDGIRALLSARRARPRSIRHRNSLVDIEFDRLVLDCISYEIADRPRTASDLADALERIRTRKMVDSAKVSRSRVTRWGTAAAVVSLGAVIGLGIIEKQPAPAAVQEAHENELTAGYLSLNNGDWKTAANQFGRVLETDRLNRAAVIGLNRARAHLQISRGGADEIERLVNGKMKPELASFVGYLHALNGEDDRAIAVLSYARRSGLSDEAVLTNLAFSLLNKGDDPHLDEAAALLDEVRQRYGDREQANLLLFMVKQNRSSRTGGLPLKDALSLTAACPPSGVKFRFQSLAYQLAGLKAMRKDPALSDQYFQEAVDQLKEACRRGQDLRHWNNLRSTLPKPIQEANAEFFAEAGSDMALHDPREFTIDPLAGWTLQQVIEASIDQVQQPITIAGN